MSTRIAARRRILVGTAAAAAALLLSACTSTPEPAAPSEEPQASATPALYDGPFVFVGDELLSFLPSSEEVVSVAPDAVDITEPSAVVRQISDGYGLSSTPGICDALRYELSLGAVGVRALEWVTSADPEYNRGSVMALAFADEQQAATRMDQLLQAANQCAQFTIEQAATFESVIVPERDGARALAGTVIESRDEHDWRVFQGFASVGNVIVVLWHPFTGDRTYDAEAAALLLQGFAVESATSLRDSLTAAPPTTEPQPVADESAPWKDWQFGVDGVGPVLLGAPTDEAVAAAGGVVSETPAATWQIANPEGTGTLEIVPVEGGDTVWYVTAGQQVALSAEVQSGADLPALGEIRVGDSLVSAMDAFAGGTTFTVSSSGENYYIVSTRDGRAFRFDTDLYVGDPVTITGITVEDATQRTTLPFG